MDKLFEPTSKFIKSTNLYKFQKFLEKKISKNFLSYNKLWQWSNENPENFWLSIVEYFNIDLKKKDFSNPLRKEIIFGIPLFLIIVILTIMI